jgi:ceramide glucosyltransferase
VPIDARHGLVWCGYAFALASMAYSLISAFATRKIFSAAPPNREALPPVTILKPLYGAEPETYECLRSFCEQTYPQYQVIFGVCDPQDPAVAVVHRLQREFPSRDLVLAADRKEHGSNRKVNNLINMMAHARHDYLVVSDSDVKVDGDYLTKLIPPLLDAGVGIVTCRYRGVPRPGIWSLLGSMYINEWFMPSVRVAALLGYRTFAFGATIGIRRETLARIGGFNSVSNQLADDYRLAELTRQLGLRTVLSPVVVDTLVQDCTAADLVAHELRWRRTIRNLNPYGYVFSVVTLGLPVTALQLLLTQGAAPAAAIFSATAVASALIHFNARRPGTSTAVLLLVPIRDLLHVGLWIWSFATRHVQWGDDHYEVSQDGAAQPIEGLGR